jgi:hypothetical protein
MIPLCKNCVYCRQQPYPDQHEYLCREPGNIDVVTGVELDVPCYDSRGGRCGRDGVLFKAAPGEASINLATRGALPLSA